MTDPSTVLAEEWRTARVLLRAVDCESVSTLTFDPRTRAGVLTTWDDPTARREQALVIGRVLAARLVAAARRHVAVPLPTSPRPATGGCRDDLAIPLHGPDGRVVTWWLTRLGRAFGSQDVDHATLLAPGLLGQLGRPAAPSGTASSEAPAGAPVAVRAVRPLTGRELEVLRLVGRGLTAAAVGRRLAISERTVQKHLEHVYDKLGCTDRLSAVLAARTRELL